MTEVSLPPAALVLSNPSVDQTFQTGGTGRFSVTVTNSGGRTSAEQAVTIALPAGVSLAGVTVDGAAAAVMDAQTCRLPAIEPGASVTVVLSVAVSENAVDGVATATIDGRAVQWELGITR